MQKSHQLISHGTRNRQQGACLPHSYEWGMRRRVRSVNQNHVEGVRLQALQGLPADHGLYGGKDVLSALLFLLVPGQEAKVAALSAKHPVKAGQGLPGNLFPVHKKEETPGLHPAHGKGGGIGLAGPSGRDEQGTLQPLAVGAYPLRG